MVLQEYCCAVERGKRSPGEGQQENRWRARVCALSCEQTDGLGLHFVLPFACLMAQRWR